MTGQVIVPFHSHILEKSLSGYSIVFGTRWWLLGKHSLGTHQWCQHYACGVDTNTENACGQLSAPGMKSGRKVFAYFPILLRVKDCKSGGREKWTLYLACGGSQTGLPTCLSWEHYQKIEDWSKVQRHCEIVSNNSREII